MLNAEERKAIKKSVTKATKTDRGNSSTKEILSAWENVALRDAPRLLNALDKAEEEIDHLRDLVGKLYKIVNLASMVECDHRCLTKDTQNQLLTILAQAQAAVKARQAHEDD